MDYKFKSVCPVVNVPFFENGDIDYEGLGNIVESVISDGCKSVCIFAFNSEPHKMSFTEKMETIKVFLQQVDRRIETLVGIIENSIKGGIELAKQAEKYGADGLILYPPSLSTPSGDSLINYFSEIASAVDLEIMIQDNPRSTGVNMSLDFIISAFNKIEKFRYLKVECPIPMRKMSAVVAETDDKLKCYSGNGGIFAVEAFLNGAWGIMPGVAMTKYFVKMYDLLEKGRTSDARAVFERLLPLVWYEDQSLEFYISCEKKLLKADGVIKSDSTRKPDCTMSESEEKELFELYYRMVDEIDKLGL